MHCPDCGFENIPGADQCESCGQPLIDVHFTNSDLEHSICTNCVELLEPRTPVTIAPSLTVREALQEMVGRRIGCLLVEEDGVLAGIFTERDVLNKVGDDLDASVATYMTSNPETISKRDSIAYALHAMDLGGYRHLAIVDETGHATGIISVRDILHFLCAQVGDTPSHAG